MTSTTPARAAGELAASTDASTTPTGLRLELSDHGYPGHLVTVCGIDGAGKTTAVEAIRDRLRTSGRRVHLTQIPTLRMRNDPLFRAMVDKDPSGETAPVDMYAMCLSMLGDLRQHLTEYVEPLLARGDVVICDRYIFTHLGEMLARALDARDAGLVAQLSDRFVRPDLSLFIEASPTVAASRIRARGIVADEPAHHRLAAAQARAYAIVAAANGMVVITSEQPLDVYRAQLVALADALGASRSGR